MSNWPYPNRGVVGGDLDVAGLEPTGGAAVRDVKVADPLLRSGHGGPEGVGEKEEGKKGEKAFTYPA